MAKPDKEKKKEESKEDLPDSVPAESEKVDLPQADNEPANTDNKFGAALADKISEAGTLELSEDEKAALYAPLDPEDVSIRPDSMIYVAWHKYAKRLNDAFGGAGWAMIPEGHPLYNDEKTLVTWGFHLMIRGTYTGYALGECEHKPESKRMTFGDAAEAAKSNALMRLCKNMGMTLELWDKEFAKNWLADYAYKGNNGKWFKSKFPKGQNQPQQPPQQQEQKPPPSSKPKYEKIPEAELNRGKTLRAENAIEGLLKCKTSAKLKEEFKNVKTIYEKEKYTAREVNFIRHKANDYFVILSSKEGKGK